MSTFAELQKNLLEAKGRKAVLTYLADVLEAEFLPLNPENPPKRLLLLEDKTPVPTGIIDTVVSDLLKEVVELDEQSDSILKSTLQEKNKVTSKGTVQ